MQSIFQGGKSQNKNLICHSVEDKQRKYECR